MVERVRLSAEELQAALAKRDDIPARDFLVSVGLFFTAPALMAIYPSVWTGLLCVLINLHVLSRFAQLVHNADHGCLFKTERFDRIVGLWSGYFVGYLQEGHANTHNDHHRYLNTERDADRKFCEPEAPTSDLLKGFLRDIALVTAASRFLQYVPQDGAAAEQRGRSLGSLMHTAVRFLPVVAIQLALIAIYTAGAGFDPLIGVAFWLALTIAPLFILYPAIIRVRSTVEHSFPPGHVIDEPGDRRIIRSTRANWLERFVIAPLHGTYHYEHHVLQTMPYYNAPLVRSLMQGKPGFSVPMADGYVWFVVQRWRAERRFAAAP